MNLIGKDSLKSIALENDTVDVDFEKKLNKSILEEIGKSSAQERKYEESELQSTTGSTIRGEGATAACLGTLRL